MASSLPPRKAPSFALPLAECASICSAPRKWSVANVDASPSGGAFDQPLPPTFSGFTACAVRSSRSTREGLLVKADNHARCCRGFHETLASLGVLGHPPAAGSGAPSVGDNAERAVCGVGSLFAVILEDIEAIALDFERLQGALSCAAEENNAGARDLWDQSTFPPVPPVAPMLVSGEQTIAEAILEHGSLPTHLPHHMPYSRSAPLQK